MATLPLAGALRRESFSFDGEAMRLDQFLVAQLPQYSRMHLKGLIERGCVRVDGVLCKPRRQLKAGSRVEISYPAAAIAREGELKDWIIHEDKHLLVLNKPAGLLMHPLGTSWLTDLRAALSDVANLAGVLLQARPGIAAARVPRTGIVHRLDRQTSGVLLVAKTRTAYEKLLKAFKDRRIEKIYRAIVRGVPQNVSSRVKAPIGRLPGHRRVVVTPFGKSAETGLTVLEACSGNAIVEARPISGRTHQIRAHLALLGHPVAGDPEHEGQNVEPRPERLMLHAYRIRLTHPGTGKEVIFKAELSADFKAFWKLCRKKR